MSFHTNIADRARENSDFRRVLFTGDKSQLVVMCIPPGGEIGTETHEHVEQVLFIVEGQSRTVLDGVESRAQVGDVVIVTPGVEHNLVNDGAGPLRIITVYAPANHIDGRIHRTKEEADRDTEDEAFGHQ